MAFSLQARVVFAVDQPPIEHGVVTIDGERIAAVGTRAIADEVTDLGKVALLPGLVNAHTHLEFSYLGQPLGKPGMRLTDWIRLVIAERGRADVALPLSICRGASESLQAGVTTLGDIGTAEVPVYFTPIDVTIFAEVIGFSRARSNSALSSVIERLAWTHEAGRTYGIGATSNGRPGISPHAPYTVSPALLKQLVVVATERSLPCAMHLAESIDEIEFLNFGTGPFQELLEERSMWDPEAIPRGSRPLDYLRMLAEAPRAMVIHGNYLDTDERAFLAAKRERMSLVYCPRTHAYFGHPPYPLTELLAAGVRVALGTDSRASNPDLNLLAEMRHAVRMHPGIKPLEVLRMGTLAGAEALGRADEVGSITPGKRADLVAIPLAENAGANPSDLLESLLADTCGPSSVWLRGQQVT